VTGSVVDNRANRDRLPFDNRVPVASDFEGAVQALGSEPVIVNAASDAVGVTIEWCVLDIDDALVGIGPEVEAQFVCAFGQTAGAAVLDGQVVVRIPTRADANKIVPGFKSSRISESSLK